MTFSFMHRKDKQPEDWWGFHRIPIFSDFFVFVNFLQVTLFLFSLLIIRMGLRPFGKEIDGFCTAWYTHQLCGMLKIKTNVTGNPLRKQKAIIVSNHVSYIDSLVLYRTFGGHTAARMLDKNEWFLISLMWISGRAIFIRGNYRNTLRDLSKIYKNRRGREPLTMFPESHTTDGRFVDEFKSSFFSLAEGSAQNLPVQPVTIHYHLLHNSTMGRFFESLYTWIGDETFFPHLWTLLSNRGVTVNIICHPSVTLSQFDNDRKKLCRHCENVVRTGLGEMLSVRYKTESKKA